MGRYFGGSAAQSPIAEELSERLLRLPLYFGFEGAMQHEVLRALLTFAA